MNIDKKNIPSTPNQERTDVAYTKAFNEVMLKRDTLIAALIFLAGVGIMYAANEAKMEYITLGVIAVFIGSTSFSAYQRDVNLFSLFRKPWTMSEINEVAPNPGLRG